VSFAHPWVLLLAPLVALWWFLKRRPAPGMRSPSLSLWDHVGPGRTRFLWLPRGLRLLALMLMIIALARPQAGSSRSMQVSEGIAIQLLVDVSSSMDMTMETPEGGQQTRMEVAKELVESFIAGDGGKLGGRDGDLIGLITFARYADTRSPLTFGHPALLQMVKQLEVQDRPNEDGTAYGDALALAAARLKHLDEMKGEGRWSFAEEVASRVIILLTDGENNSGAHLPVEAAGLAQKWDCRIYCISLGDALPDSDGKPATSLGPSDQVLQHIGRETGGLFRKAFDYDSLKSVYEEIDQLERSAISSRNFTEVSDWFWLPAALAAAALGIALVLDSTCLRIAP
jgi:Ca-activated chloride channel family protein